VVFCACPGDEKRGGPGAAAQHRSRGRQSGYLAWLAARPAERQRGTRMQRSRVTTSLFGWCPDRASVEEARTRPSRAFTRSAAGSRGHRSIGRSPNALLLLPTLERKSRCEARCVTRARSFLMEALGLPSRNVNLALN